MEMRKIALSTSRDRRDRDYRHGDAIIPVAPACTFVHSLHFESVVEKIHVRVLRHKVRSRNAERGLQVARQETNILITIDCRTQNVGRT